MQHDVIVFLGPTLSPHAARQLLEADYRPPAQRNDVAAAASEFPRAILLIDGVFEEAPAVSHKEILWALSRGIHVLGASSMGALRAAELQDAGMIGVGDIFQAYVTGLCDRDDAVAVLHGPAELDYPSLTWPLVDAWATFANARRVDVISENQHEILKHSAASIFYKQRTIEVVLAAAQARSAACADLTASLLQKHAVSQKALDAKALLMYAALCDKKFDEPFQPRFDFEYTWHWHSQQRAVELCRIGLQPTDLSGVFEKVSRLPGHQSLIREALGLLYAESRQREFGGSLTHSNLRAATRAFRRSAGLLTAEGVSIWLEGGHITHADYLRYVGDHAACQQAAEELVADLAITVLRLMRRLGPSYDAVLHGAASFADPEVHR